MEYKVSEINLPPEAAYQKIRNWCAYQERSQHETRQKLMAYGLKSENLEEIIADLIQENFLNEERFAIAFAGGKFRIKHWGKNKIKAGLKKHKVSDYSIKKALESIEASEYDRTIVAVIEKKSELIKSQNGEKKFYSLLNYLISRGFESELVKDHLNKSGSKK
jgi:regulatory protein